MRERGAVEPQERGTQGVEERSGADHSLRGTLFTVLLMAAFFAIAWLGMYALLLARR